MAVFSIAIQSIMNHHHELPEIQSLWNLESIINSHPDNSKVSSQIHENRQPPVLTISLHSHFLRQEAGSRKLEAGRLNTTLLE
jgi:hypothetical protein